MIILVNLEATFLEKLQTQMHSGYIMVVARYEFPAKKYFVRNMKADTLYVTFCAVFSACLPEEVKFYNLIKDEMEKSNETRKH